MFWTANNMTSNSRSTATQKKCNATSRTIEDISKDMQDWTNLDRGQKKQLLEECSRFSIVSESSWEDFRVGVTVPLQRALEQESSRGDVDQNYLQLILASGADPGVCNKLAKDIVAHWCAIVQLRGCLESLKHCRGGFQEQNKKEAEALVFIQNEVVRIASNDNDEVGASLQNSIQLLQDGRQLLGLSLVSLVQNKDVYAAQNIIRRGLFALNYKEFSEQVEGRTAFEWARHHGLTGLAEEILFWKERAKNLELPWRQRFVASCRKLGAVIRKKKIICVDGAPVRKEAAINVEDVPAVWLPKCLLADAWHATSNSSRACCSGNIQNSSSYNTARPPFIEHAACNYFYSPSEFWPPKDRRWIGLLESLREFVVPRSSRDQYDRMISDMLVGHAKKYPGAISVIGLVYCLFPLVDEPSGKDGGSDRIMQCLATTAVRIGKDLNHLAQDKDGRTSLMLLDMLYRTTVRSGDRTLLGLMEKIIGFAAASLPDRQLLLNWLRVHEPHHGYTIAHSLVIWPMKWAETDASNRGSVLKCVVDKDPMLLLEKDKKGRTPEQLARDVGQEKRAELLTKLANEKAAVDSNFKAELEKAQISSLQGILRFNRGKRWNFLPIHAPSSSNASPTAGSNLQSAGVHAEKSCWDKFEKYVSDELPGLLHGATEPLVVFVPPFTPSPTPAPSAKDQSAARSQKKDGRVIGKEAEGLFLKGLHKASESSTLLDELKAKKLRLAIFHGLRYMTTPNAASTSAATPSKAGGNKPEEGEIDVILLCYSTSWDSNEGHCMMCLVEIKGDRFDGAVQKVIKKSNYKSLAQLARSFEAVGRQTSLKGKLECWTRVAVGLPNCTDNQGIDVNKHIIQKAKEEYANKKSPVAEMLSQTVLPTIEKLKLMVLRKLEIDEIDEQLKEWIESSTSPSVSMDDFQEVLSWCLIKCFGVTVTLASKAVDNHSAQSLASNLGQRANNLNGLQQQQRIALLTNTQKAILQTPSQGLLLILGNAGSGKSLLAQQKLFQMLKEEDGDGQPLINSERQAAFVSCAKNRAFNWHVKQAFRDHRDLIHVFEWMHKKGGFEKCIDEIINKQKKIEYIIIDQMEDLHGYYQDLDYLKRLLVKNFGAASSKKGVTQPPSTSFQMIWVMIKEEIFHELSFYRDVVQGLNQDQIIIRLGTRIRNADPICQAINVRRNKHTGLELVNRYLGSVLNVPKSIGYSGIKPLLAHYKETQKYGSNSLQDVLGDVVIQLDQCNLSPEDTIITWPADLGGKSGTNLLEQLDEALVERFSESSKVSAGVTSMAPILIEIPASLMRADDYSFINNENCEKALSYVQGAMGGAALKKLSRDEIYKNPLLAVADGILRRDSSMPSSGPNQEIKYSVDQFVMVLQSTLNSSNSATTPQASPPPTPQGKKTPLQTFLESFRFLSVLHWEEVDGFEANAVIVVLDKQLHDIVEKVYIPLSRAKILAVIVHEQSLTKELQITYGPTLEDDWQQSLHPYKF